MPNDHRPRSPTDSALKRIDALWNQQGWVAEDEMAWYLHMVDAHSEASTTPPLMLQSISADQKILGQWIVEASTQAAQNNQPVERATAVWKDHHWFPIQVRVCEGKIEVATTHPHQAYVSFLLSWAFGDEHTITCVAPTSPAVLRSKLPADCGFQNLAWIMGQKGGHEGVMHTEEAIKWRILFAQHLFNVGASQFMVEELRLGGMTGDLSQRLQDLVCQHGVASNRAPSVAQHLIQALGTGVVSGILSAPRPWKDLKARASALRPSYQIVLSDELQQQIDRRAAQGKPVGKKENKKPAKANTKPVITLASNQVSVPEGIFQQADGEKLKQIGLHQVQQKNRGVIIANVEEAVPFFRLSDSICKEGLALVVLDVNDPRLPPRHTKVTFPAICAETSEPMIIQGAMFQLGAMEVSRVIPQDMVRLDQVQTQVLRVMVYRDQFTHDWLSFVSNSPFKAILALPEFQALGQEGVLDVFDRQFLTKKFQKARPDQSEVFAISVRIAAQAIMEVLSNNAKGGVFYEPRNDTGRKPHESFRVVCCHVTHSQTSSHSSKHLSSKHGLPEQVTGSD